MKLNEKTLWKNIKSGDLLPVYLIKGSENYLKQKYANLLADSVVPAGLEAFNYHKLNGEDTSVDEISECVEMLPAMCERTCVFVHDFDFDGTNDGQKDKLIQLFSDLPDTCVLIFWQDTKGFSTKTKKAKEILALMEKAGAVCDLDARGQQDLVRFIGQECKRRERSITLASAQYLLDCVGEDMSNLINEIEKLCNYCPEAITNADIDELAVKSVESTAFKMIDALLAGNYDAAFTSLHILFEQRTEPTMILGAMVSTYVDMYRAKVVEQKGASVSVLKELFPVAYKSDFKLRNAAKRASRYSMASIRESLELLAAADKKLKSSFEDNQIVFEKLLIELGKARKAGRA